MLTTVLAPVARGYSIKDDYYNGINFAFLLNVRPSTTHGDDSIADRVFAKRIRSEVLDLGDAAITTGTLNERDTFWVKTTKL